MGNEMSYDALWGQLDLAGIEDLTGQWREAAGEVQCRLGNKSHLLTDYLRRIFSGLSAVSIHDIEMAGISQESEFLSLCKNILMNMGAEPVCSHELYPLVKDYISRVPLTSVSNLDTRLSLYFVLLSDVWFQYAQKKNKIVFTEWFSFGSGDAVSALRHDICAALGDTATMDELDILLIDRHYALSISKVFFQSCNQRLLHHLYRYDSKMDRHVFELMLDDDVTGS